MLVLGRQPQQDVVVHLDGVEITFRIVKVRGKTVSVGVNAPKSWGIDRSEILQVKRLEAEMQGRDATKDGHCE